MSVDVQTETKAELLEKQLKAIADPTRRRILELLKRTGGCSCVDIQVRRPAPTGAIMWSSI